MTINFPQRITENVAHFTGRAWLLPPLLSWLEQSSERMFILTGEPGTGKSSLMAWLAGIGPLPDDTQPRAQLEQFRAAVKASHFCVAESGSTAPKAFAQNLAEQLTQTVPGFGQALTKTLADQVKISATQTVGMVAEGGSVTGVYIEQLNLGNLSEELSFNRILREPLEQLYRDGYDQPILILVDALDEALTYTGPTDIVRLLAKLTDLPEQVRLLVTTRPDPRVLKTYPETSRLNLIEDTPAGVDDIRLYVYDRLDVLNEEDRLGLARQISDAAEWNFLYSHLVVQNLLSALPDIPAPSEFDLPKGLSGLYHQFLNRELGTDEGLWYTIYKSLLGLIAVAQGEGLNRTQLERIIGEDIEQTLRICKQYLDGDLPDGPFQPFHKSFADFLLEDTTNIDYRIDAIDMHRRIADHYLDTYGEDWQQCDEYGLRYLVHHLVGSQQIDKLYILVESQAWTAAKDIDTPWIASLVQDFQEASVIGSGGTVEDWARAIGYQLRRALLEERMARISDKTILFLAKLGQVDRAIELAKRHWQGSRLFFDIAGHIASSDLLKAVNILVELVQLTDDRSSFERCKMRQSVAKKIFQLIAFLSDVQQDVIDEARRIALALISEAQNLEYEIQEPDLTKYIVEWKLPAVALSDGIENVVKESSLLTPPHQAQALRFISLALPQEKPEKRSLVERALSMLESLEQTPDVVNEKIKAIVTLLPLVTTDEQQPLLETLETAGNELQANEQPASYSWTQGWTIESVAKISIDWAKRMLFESNWQGATDAWYDVVREIAEYDPGEALQLLEERFSNYALRPVLLAEIIGIVAREDLDQAQALIEENTDQLKDYLPHAYVALAEEYLIRGVSEEAQKIFREHVFIIDDEGIITARDDLQLAILRRAGVFVSVEDVQNHLMQFHGYQESQRARIILACIAGRQGNLEFLATHSFSRTAEVEAACKLADFVNIETGRTYLESRYITTGENEGRRAHAYLDILEAQEGPAKLEILLQHFDDNGQIHHFCDHMTALPEVICLLFREGKIESEKVREIIEQVYAQIVDYECPEGDASVPNRIFGGRCTCYSRREQMLAHLIGIMAQLDPDRAEEMLTSPQLQPIKIQALMQILEHTEAEAGLIERVIDTCQQDVNDPWNRAALFYSLALSLPTDMSDRIHNLIGLAEPLLEQEPEYKTNEFGFRTRVGPNRSNLKLAKAQVLMKLVSNISQLDHFSKGLNTIAELTLDQKLRALDILLEAAMAWSDDDKLALLWHIRDAIANRGFTDVQAIIAFSIPIIHSLASEEGFWRLYDYVEWAYSDSHTDGR